MKTELLITTAIIFLLYSCSQKPVITEIFDDGSYAKYEVSKKDTLKDGLYELFDPQNKILERSQFSQNQYHGLRTIYDTTQKVEVEEHYLNGRFEGSYKSYYPDGTLNIYGQYVNNEMTGPWKRHYDNGQLMESVTFEGNEENGPFIEYHPNGKLRAEGNYLDGDNEDGELKLYNITGTLERKMDCVAGRCSTTWKLDTIADEAEESKEL